jgi:integrase
MEPLEARRIVPYDPTTSGDLLLWPDTVQAFWTDQACTIRSDTTRSTWGYSYRRLQSLNPGKPVVGFTTDDLVAYVTQRHWDGPRWAPLTARNHRTALSSLFGWAHLVGRIPTDPAAPLGRLVRIRHQRARTPHWLNDTQIAALVATTDGERLIDRRDRVILLLGLLAGLRTGEASRLRWADVDLPAGVLRFIGKGAKPATVVMPAQLTGELARWKQTVSDYVDRISGDWPVVASVRFPIGEGPTASPRLRPDQNVGADGLARVVHNRGLRIGIPDLRPHDLRRTLAGMLDDQGARLQDIRLVLRHDRLATTEAYLADNPRRVEDRMRHLQLPAL